MGAIGKLEDQTAGADATADSDVIIAKLNERLARYVPPRETWTPAEEAVFKPTDLFRVPLHEAQQMQLKAIKHAFSHQYHHNAFYRKYCTMREITPGDIETYDDLYTIPLIPDLTFKQYPEGRDFARWLASVYTGDLPQVIIEGANPSYDQVIDAFNAAGMAVSYSSGTSGRFTFIPRDQRTFLTGQYALAKSAFNMWPHDGYKNDGYLLMPNPAKTNVFVGMVTSVYFDILSNVQLAIDRELTTELLQTAMSGGGQGLKGKMTSYVLNRMQRKMIKEIIQWLEQHDKTGGKVVLAGAPYILYFVMQKLQAEGKSFDLGEESVVLTGGGWKIHEDIRLSTQDFREMVRDVLGIPETSCLDLYAMVEGNGWMVQCPEGHYLHTPYTYYKPMVLNEDLTPAVYGEAGRFAFLDALAGSYPGFIITGDKVRMYEHCPVCDRPGPVLEPEVHRAEGEELRGCAEELRRTLASDFTADE
ncbi:MAG: LuxE/PaaK family acyltransferase [Halobacteriota archaeon]